MAHGVTAQEWGPCLCEGRQVTLWDPKPFRVTPNHPQLGLIHPPSLGKAGPAASWCMSAGELWGWGAVGGNNWPKFLPIQEGGVTAVAPGVAAPGEEAGSLGGCAHQVLTAAGSQGAPQ